MRKKKILILITGILCFHLAWSQDESDALRYSFLTPGGSARMQAIGGTGVSLGGEPSMMDLNPAGIGLFKNSDFSITPGLKFGSNTGNYLGENSSDNKSNFYIQQIGLVIASNNNNRKRDSKWKNVTFGLGLNRLANFNQNIFYQGNNVNSSYSDNYLITLHDGNYTNSAADRQEIAQNFPYGLSQAYMTGLIAPVEQNGQFDGWQSLPGQILDNGGSLRQSNTISSKGGLDEFSLAVAGNYNDRLFIGLGLNVPSISYSRTSDFREENTDKNGNSPLEDYNVVNNLHTDGVGVNGKVGIIYVINPQLRAGLAFHTPTLYSMHDRYTTTMTTHTSDLGTLTSTTTDITDGYPGEYDYSLTTPWRIAGGLSYIVGAAAEAAHHGFITLDYEFVNYGAARFHFNSSHSTAEDKTLAKNLNRSISNMYKGASNVRLGGELKFNIFSARAGIAYMGSPYSNPDIKGAQMQYSAGIGIRNRGFYADLTYVYTHKGDRYNQPYLVDDNEFGSESPEPALIKGHISDVLLTIGFNL